MKNTRLVQFIAAGAGSGFAAQAIGLLLDHSASGSRLDGQLLYNWACLILAPAAFVARLGNPEGPIAASLGTSLLVIAANAIYYGMVCAFCQLLFGRLAQKLAYERAMASGYVRPVVVRRMRASVPELSADL